MEEYLIEGTIDGSFHRRRFMREDEQAMGDRFVRIGDSLADLFYCRFIEQFDLFCYRIEGSKKIFIAETSSAFCNKSKMEDE